MESSQVPESFSRRGEGREISVAVEAVHHRGERVCTLLLVHSQSWVIAELSSSRRSFLSLQTRVGISSCTLCLLKLLPFFALSFSFLLLFPPSTRRGGVWISSLDFNRHRRYDALIINTDLYRRLISSPSLHSPPHPHLSRANTAASPPSFYYPSAFDRDIRSMERIRWKGHLFVLTSILPNVLFNSSEYPCVLFTAFTCVRLSSCLFRCFFATTKLLPRGNTISF